MKRLLLLLLLPSVIHSMEIPNHALISRDSVKLLHDKNHYYVSDHDATYRVAQHETSTLLREVLKRKAVSEYSDSCKFLVKKNSDGTYSINDKVPGKGGTGPITAGVVNVVVRIGCWVGLASAGIALVAVTPPGTQIFTAPVIIAKAGGAVAIAASIESIVLKATFFTLLIPLP